MKEKKIVPAAAADACRAGGQKLSKRSAWKAVRPMMTNMTSTLSLTSTMTVLTFADSLAPRISSSVHRKTRTIAGSSQPLGVTVDGIGE